MARTLNDIPLTQLAVEHYLFDLEYSVETVSEIFNVSKDTVKKIYDNYKQAFQTKSGK